MRSAAPVPHINSSVRCGQQAVPAKMPRTANQAATLRGCAKTEVALRDELSLSLRPRPAEFAAADRPHAKGPGPAVPTALDPVRGTHKGYHCQEGARIWPGGDGRRRAGPTVLLDPSAQLPGPAAGRPGRHGVDLRQCHTRPVAFPAMDD